MSKNKRIKGHSAVACAAYSLGAKLFDERIGIAFNYSSRKDIVPLPLMTPDNKADITDEVLWNMAESAESRKNSCTARILKKSLPLGLSKEAHIRAEQKFQQFLVSEYGVAVSTAIHYDRPNNPHSHNIFTTRIFSDGKLGAKTRRLDDKKQGKIETERMREAWANILNEELEAAGMKKISHKSYRRQGIKRIPGLHLGPALSALKPRYLAEQEKHRAELEQMMARHAEEIRQAAHMPEHDRKQLLLNHERELGRKEAEAPEPIFKIDTNEAIARLNEKLGQLSKEERHEIKGRQTVSEGTEYKAEGTDDLRGDGQAVRGSRNHHGRASGEQGDERGDSEPVSRPFRRESAEAEQSPSGNHRESGQAGAGHALDPVSIESCLKDIDAITNELRSNETREGKKIIAALENLRWEITNRPEAFNEHKALKI